MKPYQSLLRFGDKQSAVTAISEGSTIGLELDPSFVHNFAGVTFYNDSDGVTPVQPSAGTVTFTIKTSVQSHAFQTIPNNILQANVPGQVDWASNSEFVLATLSGIVGATHARLFWAGNSS